MLTVSRLKDRWRTNSYVSRANHYWKRYLQTGRFYLDEWRWRRRWNGEESHSEEGLQALLRVRCPWVSPKPKGQLTILYVGYGEKLANGEVVDRYAVQNVLFALRMFGTVTAMNMESPKGTFSREWKAKKRQFNRELLSLIQRMCPKPDVLIGQMWGWYIERETLEQVKSLGIATINYSWDDTAAFYGDKIDGQWSGPAALAPIVDLNLTSSPRSRLKYQAEGGLALFWPEGANPEIHKPYDVPFEYDVSFVGGRYGYRPLLVEFLRQRGVKVAAFGPGWDGGMLSADEMIGLYSRSRINLGFGGIGHMVKVQHLKGRDFEIPMSGGLYLTSYNPELEECYEIGKEVVCYKDKWDCLEKIKYYLTHPHEAELVRRAGRARALRDHTWECRLEKVFRIVGVLQ